MYTEQHLIKKFESRNLKKSPRFLALYTGYSTKCKNLIASVFISTQRKQK